MLRKETTYNELTKPPVFFKAVFAINTMKKHKSNFKVKDNHSISKAEFLPRARTIVKR